MSELKYLPKENMWVLGLCRFTKESMKDLNPIWTQVKYQSNFHGWSDWCGDLMIDVDMEVIDWVPLPVTGVA